MGKGKIILIVVVLLAIFAGATVGLYFLGDNDQSALERLRDIAIIYLGFLWLIALLLLVVLVFLAVWLAITIKNKVVPALDTMADAAKRVKGTTEFITEEVAAPVISFYGTVAKARAMTRTVTG